MLSDLPAYTIWKFSSTLILCFLFVSNSSIAQPAPIPVCNELPCTDTLYNADLLEDYTYQDTCYFQIRYGIRYFECDGEYRYDVYIYYIERNYYTCADKTLEEIYETAHKYILSRFCFGLGEPSACVDTLKLTMGHNKCIRLDTLYPPNLDPVVRYRQCYEDCCLFEYTLFYDVLNNPDSVEIVSVTNVTTGADTCEFPYDDICSYTCDYYVMEGMIEKEKTEWEKISIRNKFKQNLENYTYVIPNPASDEVEVFIQNEQKGNLLIKIFDSKGGLVYTKELLKNDKKVSFRISTNEYQSGQYYYKIVDFENNAYTGKFIVFK